MNLINVCENFTALDEKKQNKNMFTVSLVYQLVEMPLVPHGKDWHQYLNNVQPYPLDCV